jgi:hypothetical protein
LFLLISSIHSPLWTAAWFCLRCQLPLIFYAWVTKMPQQGPRVEIWHTGRSGESESRNTPSIIVLFAAIGPSCLTQPSSSPRQNALKKKLSRVVSCKSE